MDQLLKDAKKWREDALRKGVSERGYQLDQYAKARVLFESLDKAKREDKHYELWRKSANQMLDVMKKLQSGFKPKRLEPKGDLQLRTTSDELKRTKFGRPGRELD